MLVHGGYKIKKSKIQNLDSFKESLTVKPENIEYEQENNEYPVYSETEKYFLIPKFYGLKEYGKTNKEKYKYHKTNFQFLGKLRDYQTKIVKTCVKHIQKHDGGILSVHCGQGKTVMALKIASELKVKTLVVVHKTFLQDQWIERAKQFTDAKLGIIRQKYVDIKDKDIVIGMMQSISMRDYDPSIFKEFGFVIYDETHHYASRVFCQGLLKTSTKYSLGLSATLERSDKLTKVLHWNIGDIIFQQGKQRNIHVIVKQIFYSTKNPLFKEKTNFIKGKEKPSIPKMISDLVAIKNRNKMLLNILFTLSQDPSRKILVLSDRRDHLKFLKEKLDQWFDSHHMEIQTFLYIGGQKELERKKAEKNGDILFATFHIANEGLDIERLNTVLLATPKKNVIQAVGRVLRKVLQIGDIRPLIIDINDQYSVFKGQTYARAKQYKSSSFKIEKIYSREGVFVSKEDFMDEETPIDECTHIPTQTIIDIDCIQSLSSSSESSSSSSASNSDYFKDHFAFDE